MTFNSSESSLGFLMKAIGMITRPPRSSYDPDTLNDIVIKCPDVIAHRSPFEFKNRRGETIIGSVYEPPEHNPKCVIYMHGNIGSQREGRGIVRWVGLYGVSVCCFDFSGSGLSDGDFVTLGSNESNDVVDLVCYLRNEKGFKEFVLWGRSMGATVAILSAPCAIEIKGIIVDSAYASVLRLIDEYSKRIPIPQTIRNVGCWMIRGHINAKTGTRIDDADALMSCKVARVPLLIGHALDDDFIPFQHSRDIFDAYCYNDKEIVEFEGGHNGIRPKSWLEKCVRFILRVLNLEYTPLNFEIPKMKVEHSASVMEMVK